MELLFSGESRVPVVLHKDHRGPGPVEGKAENSQVAVSQEARTWEIIC